MNILELKSYHALNLAYVSNYEALKKILGIHGSWHKAWAAIQNNLAGLPLGRRVDADLEWLKLEQNDVRLMLNTDKDFPALLKEIPWSPHGLYIRGAELNDKDKLIAIVGTRKASSHGKKIARQFASSLAERGLTVVSGLALGIDAAAHEGTLDAKGKTIAVLANGLDRVYPRYHEKLAEKILDSHGTLISEYPLGTPSLPHQFIERNRIVSGFSLGVIIVEAPKESGALATARFALEQNREIFVVPGQIDNPNYAGSHELIKSGAALTTSVADVLTNLNLETRIIQPTLLAERLQLDENQRLVINVLKAVGEKIEIDRIATLANLEVSAVNRLLSFLTVKGIVKEENGKYYI